MIETSVSYRIAVYLIPTQGYKIYTYIYIPICSGLRNSKTVWQLNFLMPRNQIGLFPAWVIRIYTIIISKHITQVSFGIRNNNIIRHWVPPSVGVYVHHVHDTKISYLLCARTYKVYRESFTNVTNSRCLRDDSKALYLKLSIFVFLKKQKTKKLKVSSQRIVKWENSTYMNIARGLQRRIGDIAVSISPRKTLAEHMLHMRRVHYWFAFTRISRFLHRRGINPTTPRIYRDVLRVRNTPPWRLYVDIYV